MRVVVSSAGRFHSVHLAKALRAKGLLHQFCSAGLNQTDRQTLPAAFTSFFPAINLLDRAYVKLRADRLITPSRWYTIRDGLFDHWSAKKIEQLFEFNLFVGWANCSLNCINKLKPKGVKTIIESGSMHIAVQEKILQDEYEKWGAKLSPIVKQNKDKMLEEYSLTDKICVPSTHVADSFVSQGISQEKIIKVPYGIDFEKFGYTNRENNGKFSLIFVGQISLQKGIGYLLKAWKILNIYPKKAELLLVGNVSPECEKMVQDAIKSDLSIKLIGPVRHDQLSQLYARADAFVLPSVQEGLAMVIGEAMASALPVICTTRTGGLELINDGQEGFVVQPGDEQALSAKIELLYKNPDQVKAMGQAARQKAKTLSWQNYADSLVCEYEKLVGQAL